MTSPHGVHEPVQFKPSAGQEASKERWDENSIVESE